MNILLTGASGFIGQAVHTALTAQGHTVIRAVRKPTSPSDIAVDFERDTTPAQWLPRLNGIDAVVNAVGIMGGSDAVMWNLHCHTPTALAKACAQAGIKRFVQVSSLGVDSGLDTLYFRTKLAGEQGIRAAMPQAGIIRPSLVFGMHGASSQLFIQLTRLPIIALPHAGKMQVQPVHGSDVGAGVAALLMQHTTQSAHTIAAVGTQALSMADYLKSLAAQLNRGLLLRLQLVLPMPLFAANLSAKLAACLPQYLWTPDTLAMLCAGNTADAQPFIQLLGREPVALNAFVQTDKATHTNTTNTTNTTKNTPTTTSL
jgi:uncharacterized protein YbjT (DUF2867 family)